MSDADDYRTREWTPAQEAAARQNAASLNASLTRASGFGEGGANRLAFENLGNDIGKKLESQGLIKNLKPEGATVKSQFGSMGEEPSVAISKSAGESNVSVPFPFDETKITVPSQVPEAFKGLASNFGSIASGIENSIKGSNLEKTLPGMFNSAATTMSSVISGVGSGMTSALGSVADKLGAAAKSVGSLTSAESPEQKFAFKANPFASLEDQAAAFKTFATKLEADLAPVGEEIKGQLGGLTNSIGGAVGQLKGSLSAIGTNVGGAVSSAVGGLKSAASGLAANLQGAAGQIPRISGLSTLADKTPAIPTSSSFADVIKQTTGAFGGALSNLSNTASADVLAAKQSRAQLFPVDQLESKLKSVGESLKPSIVSIKDQISSSLPSGLQAPGTGGITIDQGQVDKDVSMLKANDPTLTDSEARDQATRNQQLNKSLTRAFGFGG
jgi:hypothetical protein